MARQSNANSVKTAGRCITMYIFACATACGVGFLAAWMVKVDPEGAVRAARHSEQMRAAHGNIVYKNFTAGQLSPYVRYGVNGIYIAIGIPNEEDLVDEISDTYGFCVLDLDYETM